MTIDDQLFPTNITTQPDKFGIQFWMATDMETKYLCNTSPYLEKDPGCQKCEAGRECGHESDGAIFVCWDKCHDRQFSLPLWQ